MQIGQRLREARQQRGMTIQELARLTELSKGFLSQIENDKASPSLDTLERIAQAVDVPLAYILLPEERRMHVVRAADRPTYRYGAAGLNVEVLSPLPQRGIALQLVELPQGAASGDADHFHPGEECHVVLDGVVRAEQGDHAVILHAGDAFYWDGSIPHRVVNVGNEPARLMIALAAPAHFAPSVDEGQSADVPQPIANGPRVHG